MSGRLRAARGTLSETLKIAGNGVPPPAPARRVVVLHGLAVGGVGVHRAHNSHLLAVRHVALGDEGYRGVGHISSAVLGYGNAFVRRVREDAHALPHLVEHGRVVSKSYYLGKKFT